MVLMAEFWNMGGYGLYVWPAYGVSLLALFAIGWLSFKKMKTLEKRLKNIKEVEKDLK